MARAKRRTGIYPFAYMGAEPNTPAQFTIQLRSPTDEDHNNWNIGSIWLDMSFALPTDYEIWMLVDKDTLVATWIKFETSAGVLETLTGDSGGAVSPDGTSTINVVSGFAPLTIDGNPGTFTLTINSDGTIPTSVVTDSGTAIPSGSILNVVGGDDVTVTGSGNTVTIGLDGSIANQYDTDSGSAVPALGILDILGGTGINTAGATSVVTVNLDIPVLVIHGGTELTTITDHGVMLGSGTGAVTPTAVGTDGQLLLGATAADPAFASITSTGGTVTITPGTNTLNIETTIGVDPSGFSAYLSSTQLNETGDGTQFFFICDTETFDTGGDYDHTTGIYTVAETAEYLFGMACAVTGQTINPTTILIALLDSNAVDYYFTRDESEQEITTYIGNGTMVIQLDAADTIKPFITASGTTKKIDIVGSADPRQTFFYGLRVPL